MGKFSFHTPVPLIPSGCGGDNVRSSTIGTLEVGVIWASYGRQWAIMAFLRNRHFAGHTFTVTWKYMTTAIPVLRKGRKKYIDFDIILEIRQTNCCKKKLKTQ